MGDAGDFKDFAGVSGEGLMEVRGGVKGGGFFG